MRTEIVEACHGRLLDAAKLACSAADRLHGEDFKAEEFLCFQDVELQLLVKNALYAARRKLDAVEIVFVGSRRKHCFDVCGLWRLGFRFYG